ncbi:hypothetical protein [Catellatospora sp. NPDC049609]|uniref:hypothetical protein n=1 Tax=Catellatospora sp. NPDC049609 TaxID=3155505 RepID=UPI003425842D
MKTTNWHWSGLVGAAGLILGVYMLFYAVEEHDAEYLTMGGVFVIGGALLRVEAAIRQRGSD